MSTSKIAQRPPIEIVIPDCCNIGVTFRTLIAVNGVVLMALMVQANGLQAAFLRFVEASLLVELACLTSLLALCGMRRIARTIPPWGQRTACALVPAAITVAIIRMLSANELFAIGLSAVSPVEGMFAAGLFGFVLQHYFELRTRAYSPALAEARLQALQARIRPHFLFNSLNAVLSMIRTEPRRAEETLEDLADLFRVLMRDARDITSLAEELHLCKQYLAIEKIRLGDRLQVQWDMVDVDADVLGKAQIPALLLQPLLENAVHYGVEPARGPVLIQVSISRSIDRIEIEIVNPISGNREEQYSQGNHMALDNIRQRLALLHDVEAQLMTAVARGFFQVRLRLPYVRHPS